MKELVCPNCNTTFQVDESTYALILEQVRGKEFNTEVNRRIIELQQQFTDDREKLRLQLEKAHDKTVAAKDKVAMELQAQIDILKAKLDNFETRKTAEILKCMAQKDKDISILREQLAGKDSEIKIKVMEERNHLNNQIRDKEKDILELQSKLELQESMAVTREMQLKEQQKLLLQSKQEEIDRLKDFKMRLSTKMVGETLEQHCATEFEKARAMGLYPDALFGKDNTVVDGTKGDFIFRDFINGTEYVSVMFEMKNETDSTVGKHRNDDFLQKLDKDRTKKNCEYAVLVSMLEQDNELYNIGMVDKSHLYPKMIVIRPQFFMPVLRLITQASRKGFMEQQVLLQQLAEANSYSADFKQFEKNINRFREDFGKNITAAKAKFAKAYSGIDKAIESMEKQIRTLREIKENFEASEQRLLKSGEIVDERLTVKRLTHGAPEIRKKMAKDKDISQ